MFIHIHTWDYLAKTLSRSNTYSHNLLCTCYGVDTLLRALHELSHLILTTTQSGKYSNNFYLTNEEPEGVVTYQS